MPSPAIDNAVDQQETRLIWLKEIVAALISVAVIGTGLLMLWKTFEQAGSATTPVGVEGYQRMKDMAMLFLPFIGGAITYYFGRLQTAAADQSTKRAVERANRADSRVTKVKSVAIESIRGLGKSSMTNDVLSGATSSAALADEDVNRAISLIEEI